MAGALRQPDQDQSLVRRAKSGESQAFEELVSRHERGLYTLARRIVRNPTDAEEIVQEAFLSAFEHLQEFQEHSTFRTWLVRIATNHALKLLRSRRSHPPMLLDDLAMEENADLPHPDFIAPWRRDPMELVADQETQRELTRAIEALDDKYRLVFLLRDVEGMSTEEAAEALGISVSNAKVRLLRARLMLRERLTRRFGDPARRVLPGHAHARGLPDM